MNSSIPTYVFNFLNTGITTVVGWFSDLMVASNMTAVYLPLIFIFLIWRFLLSPLLGGAGSDKAKKSKSKSGKEK